MKYVVYKRNPETNEETLIKEVSKLTLLERELDLPIHVIRKNYQYSEGKIGEFKPHDTYKQFYDTVRIYSNKKKDFY